MPDPLVGEPSPAQRRVEDRRVDERARVREMDRALEALDELLFAHPEPTAWGDAERASFQLLRGQVEAVCAESPRGGRPRPVRPCAGAQGGVSTLPHPPTALSEFPKQTGVAHALHRRWA